MSVREIHNSLVRDPEDVGLKEARDSGNNIIISDSTLRSLFPPQHKKCQHDTSSCVVVNVVYLPKVYSPRYYHGVIGIKKNTKIKSKTLKTEGPVKNKIT